MLRRRVLCSQRHEILSLLWGKPLHAEQAMRYTYHVITPLTRFENLTKLMKMLESQEAPIEWHVITDENPAGWRVTFERYWACNYPCPNTAIEFWARCNFSINWFLDKFPPKSSDRYLFLNDDDAYEPGFFEKLDQHDGDVLICSMERGQRTPAVSDPLRAHGCSKLEAKPENMHPTLVGVEQIIMSGRVLKDVRLPLAVDGDGRMIEWVCANHPVTYVPEATVWFNYYEPGRWDK